ncbi:MAG: hypothetical protein A3F11_00070 [Gammaproteobacteria bacterium RIFCSPHIGHO2_12_FULL_37_14]|nr:MAG: hypothetical protein A3F11_00070 [Gammaproteobacteria bacterium RIFCSPHIGHO2_12_FULL_37_14]
MKIVADDHIPYVKEYFNSQGELILKPGRAISYQDVKDADILLVRSITRVNEALLANTNIKFVGSVTAGTDHLDTSWLKEANIYWQAAAGFNAPPVADYVVSVIAAMQKRGLLCHSSPRAAVIGVGNVGRLVAERLKLLNFDVMLVDPLRAEIEKNFKTIPLEQITDVDLISLHVPLTCEGQYPTYQFINQNILKNQKPDCVLLNASRGKVIHTEDLQQYGKHCHWCFDVWPNEPYIDQAILANSKIATPHIAGYSIQSKIRGIALIYQAACQAGIIESTLRSSVDMPLQKLAFTESELVWQDVVLNVFNPFIMTKQMRDVFLKVEDNGKSFDNLRNHFNYRHEFSFIEYTAKLDEPDKMVLNNLGFKFGDALI